MVSCLPVAAGERIHHALKFAETSGDVNDLNRSLAVPMAFTQL